MKDLLPRNYCRILVLLGGLLCLASLGLFFFAKEVFVVWKSWLLLAWAFYLCHLLGVWWIVNRLYHPIKQVERQLSRLQEGNYDADYVQQLVPIYNQLGKNMALLGQEVAILEQEHGQQQAQIELLLRHLSVGVLALDLRGQVTLASQSMQAYFPESDVVGEAFIQLNKTAELNRLVQEVYDRKVTLHQEMDFYFPEGRWMSVCRQSCRVRP